MAMKDKESDDYLKWFYKKAILVTLSFGLLITTTAITMSFDPKSKDKEIIAQISRVENPKQKETLMKIQKMRDDKILNPEYQSVIFKQSNALNSELQKVQEILSSKEYVPKTDRIKALQHVINAKGHMEKLKSMKLPVDALLIQINDLERELYQTAK